MTAASNALRALDSGDLPTARSLLLDPQEPASGELALARGLIALWDGEVRSALDLLSAASRAISIEINERALDALIVCDVHLHGPHVALPAAHQLFGTVRYVEPVITVALLEAFGSFDAHSGRDHWAVRAHPHARAFGGWIRAEAARADGDIVNFRLEQAAARSILHPRRAGLLLANALNDPDVLPVDATSLSQSERAILAALSGPLTLEEIGRELRLSRNTVKTHVRSIFMKLGVHDRRAAVAADPRSR